MQLIKNYLYNLLSQIFLLLVPLVTVPYISRVLGSYGVGVNAYTNSVISYFVLFASMGINSYGNRAIAYVRDDSKKMSQTFWEIAILRAVTVVAVSLVYIAYVYNTENLQLALWSQFPMLMAVIFDISWFFMGIEDFKKTVMRNIAVKLLTLVLVFSFVKTVDDIYIYILILSLSQLLSYVVLWPYLRRLLVPIDWKELHIMRHFVPAWGLLIPEVAIQVYLVINKTMLGSFSGLEATGYFDNADRIVRVLLSAVVSVGTVMLPRMANEFAKGKHDKVVGYLQSTFQFNSFIAFPLAFGLISIAKDFSHYFYGEAFVGIESIMAVLALVIIAISWSNAVGKQYLLPTNQMKGYTGSVICGAISNISFNLILIPQYGAMGAAVAAVASEMIVTMVQLFYIRHDVRVRLIFIDVWKYFVSASVMLGVVWGLGGVLEGVLGLIIRVAIGAFIYLTMVYLLHPKILDNVLGKVPFLNKQ